MKQIKKIVQKNWYTLVISIAFVYFLLLKLIFVFYGYIATEEGTIIYNQKLALKGLVPFIDYDAWNSLYNDYLLGWTHLIISPTILSQRFIGVLLSIVLFLLTLKIAFNTKSKLLAVLTALLLSMGSYTFIYLSTIPYSELTMSLFILIGLLILQESMRRKTKFWGHTLAVLFFICAVFIRIQAAPAALVILVFTFTQLKSNSRELIAHLAISFGSILLLCLPFLLKSPGSFWFALTWPINAEKILLYQKSAALSINSITIYFQELFRDYSVFIVLIGVSIWSLKDPKQGLQKTFFLLTAVLTATFFFTSLVHKPPFASYIYPIVPLLALFSSYLLTSIINSNRLTSKFIITLVVLLLVQNIILFPHTKFLKTSLVSIHFSTYDYLKSLSAHVSELTLPEDEVLSFYTPLVTEADRNIPTNFNRDRFSMSLLPNSEAIAHHLFTPDLLMRYIQSKKSALFIYTDQTKQFMGRNTLEVKMILNELNKNYDLVYVTQDINTVENPKSGLMYFYARKK